MCQSLPVAIYNQDSNISVKERVDYIFFLKHGSLYVSTESTSCSQTHRNTDDMNVMFEIIDSTHFVAFN